MRRYAYALAALFLVACGGHVAQRPHGAHPLLGDARRNATSEATGPVRIDRVEIAPASASRVGFARIAKYPEPGWNVPRQQQHAPDGRTVTFLSSEAGDETMALHAFDVATGKSEVILRAKDLGDAGGAPGSRSREEELRRERQRDRSEGITSYRWAKDKKVLVIPHGGDIYVRDFGSERDGHKARRLTKTPDPEIDPKPCDTGERVAFVRKGELFSVDVATGNETRLTTPVPGAADGITHGLSDFVAQEELNEPSGFFWSPRCDKIAYLEVDERPVEKLPVLGYRGEPDLMMQRYPRAGAKNPIVRAGIVDIATRRTTWLTFPASEGSAERYLGRFTWAPDGKALFLQSMTRNQKRVALVRVDPTTGTATELSVETSPAWVSFSPILVLRRGSDVVFTSTRTGHRHLEVRAQKDGALLRALTSGDWDVTSIDGIDEAAARVLFTGTREGALERNLYSVPLAASGAGGASIERLTPEHGVHSVRVDESGRTWLDVHSAVDRPPAATVVHDGKSVGTLPMPLDPAIAALGLRPAENVTVRAHDGTLLHGALLKPRSITGRHPVVVMVYGGPEAQAVYDAWAPRLLWQHLADRGFVVFQLDNRGSGGRGPVFAQKVHKQLGRLELDDQIAGAEWLAAQSFVDASRIGIYGHSYGGFMAALAMLEGSSRTSPLFRAGVSSSPVTDWRLYDTGYTERYMETPQENPAGYEWSDLSKKVVGLNGKLLLMHALMDENVHYTHTARLVDALIAADKPFDVLVLPGERHGLRAPSARAYVPERIATFFAENL